MAITDRPDYIQIYLTDLARHNTARAINGEISFQVIGFSVGRGGCNPTDPVHILPIDTTQQTLADQVYPDAVAGDTASFASIDNVGNNTLVYNCRLPATPTPTNADYALSELALWAEIVYAGNPSEIGTIFCYAISHMPIQCKTNRDVALYRAVINF
jgi:hypothetical protein